MTMNLILTMLNCVAIGIGLFGLVDGAGYHVSQLGDKRLNFWTAFLIFFGALLLIRASRGYLV
jgi:hypothetical protein